MLKRNKVTEKLYCKHLKKLQKELKGKCVFCNLEKLNLTYVKGFENTPIKIFKNQYGYHKCKEHLVAVGRHDSDYVSILDYLVVYFKDFEKYTIIIKRGSISHRHLHLLKF